MSTAHSTLITRLALLAACAAPLQSPAQTLQTQDDVYAVRYLEPLQVEAFGVLDNDSLDGRNAGEEGATAVLVSNVSQGTLTCPGQGPGLCANGSFEYQRDSGFNGVDSFSYQAVAGGISSPVTTVTLSACVGGPVFACWKRSAFLAKLTELGYSHIRERFEGAAWDVARSPISADSVDSKGLRWTSNHIQTNPISTGSGAAHSGAYGAFDREHGFASCLLTGCSTAVCDIDKPPQSCLYHDGISAALLDSGDVMRAVGAFVSSNTGGGGRVAIILDGVNQVDFVNRPYYNEFFGVVDAGTAGFSRFEVRELDGKVGQAEYIFVDDFDLVIESPIQADGDLAPRHAPDGVVNWADFLLAQRLVLGQITPTPDELAHGDLYPPGAPDGQLDVSDLLQLMHAINPGP